MNQQSHSSTSDLVVPALEALAGGLRALEVVSDSLADSAGKKAGEDKQRIDTAIDLLRAAISELRKPNEELRPGAAGFVLAVRRRRRARGRRLPPSE
ncbi:MAG TPA: hypothetical protein VMD09_02715 [Solirubrobacteraceae bacterium]|nr:hypothetical protein [Solirubrobacteraceae bacterium]